MLCYLRYIILYSRFTAEKTGRSGSYVPEGVIQFNSFKTDGTFSKNGNEIVAQRNGQYIISFDGYVNRGMFDRLDVGI